MTKNIFLIGFMGTGKTTVSHQLCNLLNVREIDLDREIETREQMKISKIFEIYGETYFRETENKLIREFEEKTGYVVSCGGGAVLRRNNVESMKKNGIIVLLTAKPETVYERVRHENNRPLLNGNMNVEYIAELMKSRELLYREAADVVVVTDARTPEEIGAEIVGELDFNSQSL